MTYGEIVMALGSDRVRAVEDAVAAAVAADREAVDPIDLSAHARELLIVMLATLIISPKADANKRAAQAASRLIKLVGIAIRT